LLCTLFARLHVGKPARSLIVISYEPHTSIGFGKMSYRYVKIRINHQNTNDVE